LLAFAFAKEEPGGGGVSYDVATDRLFGINCISHAAARICGHLVGDENSHIKLLTDFLQPTKDSI
jgi:hypothetical protein